MNPKLTKVYNEIERTKSKIAELQATLPGLEEQKTQLENLEFVRLIRSANITPRGLSEFIAEYRANMTRRDDAHDYNPAEEVDTTHEIQ